MTGDVRCFVALPVPARVRGAVDAAIAPAREAAPDLTWTRPEGWHVTLAFCGDVRASAVADVEHCVATVAAVARSIRCTIGEVGRFGRRVLWLAVVDHPTGAIARLGTQVQEALVTAGLPVVEQEVRPHLTIARANRRGADSTAVDDRIGPIDAAWTATTVELVRADLGGGPARYAPIGSWALAADTA